VNRQAIGRIAREFLPYAQPYRRPLAGALALLIFQVCTDVLQPLPLKVVIDNVLRHKPLHLTLWGPLTAWLSGLPARDLLTLLCAAMLGLAVLDGLFTYLANDHITSIGQRIIFDVRRALFAHIQRLSLPFHDNQRTGDLVTRLTNDISNMQDLMVSVVMIFSVNLLTVLGIAAIMLTMDWQFTLIALSIMPVLFAVMRYYSTRIKAATRRARKKEGEIASVVQETISSIRIVQAFTREEHEQVRFDQHNQASRDANMDAIHMQSRFTPLVDILMTLGMVLIVWYGAHRIQDGQLTLGALLVFLTYLRNLYQPVKQLAKLANVISKASASAERIVEILDTSPQVRDEPGAREAPALRGAVTFEHVSFSYNPQSQLPSDRHNTPVLQDVNLTVPAGTTVAVVGSTGAGKTTLVSLLTRFYDPTEGRVCIDGYNLRELTVHSLRRQVAVVPQEPVLFRATIWENIAYGLAEVPPGFSPAWLEHMGAKDRTKTFMDRIIEAARQANAHEFIERLPAGYHTVLGERGNTLSGGQRQRLAIARAIIRNAPILILDEPTSGLDAASEQLVMEALERLMEGRTTFVIAHRLSTIRRANLILVVEGGRIVESGTHGQLYASSGRYRQLYDLQFNQRTAAVSRVPSRAAASLSEAARASQGG
jgi:subfamily B ATP-binding cassette protein MsbA